MRDLGRYDLRDIPGPQQLVQVEADGLEESFPPLRTRSSVRTNLPHQRTTFIGRLQERDELARLLQPGVLVSVVGPGGAGKTRLALEVAGHLGPHFADGAWLVTLAGLSRGDDVGAAVAVALEPLGLVTAPESTASSAEVRQAIVARHRATRPGPGAGQLRARDRGGRLPG